MSSYAQRLAERLARTVTGPMWHGPALDELLDHVTASDAAARPVPGAHSIWELALHVAVWAEISRERLDGRALAYPAPDIDWPRAPTASDATDDAWRAARERLRSAYRALADAARTLDDDALGATVPEQKYSVATMLRGVVEHGTYHGGQIALLRRALSGPANAR